MGRKTETFLTFKLRIKMPPNTNTAMVQKILREAIEAIPTFEDDPRPFTNPEDFTLALLRKETNYA